MSRRLRPHVAGGTYHIMLRGNDGQPIFFSDGDRCRLCLLSQEGIERFGHRVVAFCFMANHIHLAIQVGEVSVSRIIQNLSFRYTRYINWKHDRVGHLFQGRFKSILVDEGRYLRELVRYIHLNPVRVGIVCNPEDYRWSSHEVYLGRQELTWVKRSYLLRRFGESLSIAVPAFQTFVLAGIGCHDEVDFQVGAEDGVLGDDDFLESVWAKVDHTPTKCISMVELVTALCEIYEIDVTALRAPGKDRKLAHVRAMLGLLVRDTDGLTFEELSNILGREASSLSKYVTRLLTKSLGSEELRHEIERVRERVSEISR